MSSKLKFNPETNKFEEIEYIPEKTSEARSNFVGEEDGIPYLDAALNPDVVCSRMNELLDGGYFEVLKCRECGQYFVFRHKESRWYSEMGLEHPKRCRGCRKARERRRLKTSGELQAKVQVSEEVGHE